MKHLPILFFVLIFSAKFATAQNPTGQALLTKSINYHDPEGKWDKWQPTFTVLFERPNGNKRRSVVAFNNKKNNFHLTVKQNGRTVERMVKKEVCQTLLDGETSVVKDTIKKYRLNCDRTFMYRNYYTYLYGMPMKLNDPGTIINDEVKTVTFHGKSYLRMRVTYEEAVGKDIWYFYFNPNSYALEAYQFFHDEAKNDGEYILFEGEKGIDGIKIPKDRTWYYNSDDKLLGTDRIL